jgi:hypothetical protein
LKKTLEDRALPLFMLRRRRSEPVARLGRATEAEAQALRDHCTLASLTRIQEVCAAYERAPDLLEQADKVRVAWHAQTLWFVPEERDAETLVRDGVSRGRVWTAAELMDVMAISGLTREAVQTIAMGKLTFDGDIAAVIRRSGGTIPCEWPLIHRS